jgi:hypothetical protein
LRKRVQRKPKTKLTIADGGFGNRVGCIPPVWPMSQVYPGRLTAKEMAGAATAEAVAASVKRHVLLSE